MDLRRSRTATFQEKSPEHVRKSMTTKATQGSLSPVLLSVRLGAPKERKKIKKPVRKKDGDKME